MNETVRSGGELDDLNEVESPKTYHEVEVLDMGHGSSPQLVGSECSEEDDSPIRRIEAIFACYCDGAFSWQNFR